MDYNTFHNQIDVQGESQDCSLVGFIQTPNGRLAVVFNRHPCHQLGCDSVWGKFPNLVDCRTFFVARAVHSFFFVDCFALGVCREVEKEKKKINLSEKKKTSKKKFCRETAVRSEVHLICPCSRT